MPAASASPIPAGLGQLAGSGPARSDELPGLLDRLSRLPYPRRLRGRRHPLSYVLALAACSVLAGAKSLTAIAEWAADAPDRLLLHCGATLRDPDRPYRAPSEATVRRVLFEAESVLVHRSSTLRMRLPSRPENCRLPSSHFDPDSTQHLHMPLTHPSDLHK